jgi:hypothetical protein
MFEHPLLHANLGVVPPYPGALCTPGGLLGRRLFAFLAFAGCPCTTVPPSGRVIQSVLLVAVVLRIADLVSDSLCCEDHSLACLELSLADMALVRTQLELLLEPRQPTRQRRPEDCDALRARTITLAQRTDSDEMKRPEEAD